MARWTDRAALARCLRGLEAGDVLLVAKLDRLARSTRDLLNTLAAVADRGASFKSLRDPWADTTTPHGRLMLTVLGGLAEFERHLILARTNEGRMRAKARGVRFGRKLKLTKHQQQEALARREAGEPLTEIARTFVTQLSRLQKINHSGSGPRVVFFLRRMAEVRKDGDLLPAISWWKRSASLGRYRRSRPLSVGSLRAAIRRASQRASPRPGKLH